MIGGQPAPLRRVPRRALLGDARSGLLAGLLAAATAAIPLLHTPSFYFSDDFQTYFLPGFLEIARLIKAGEWPFLSPRLFQGGAFLAEYQYALFNPFSVGLYLILDGFDRLDRAAASFVLIHIGLLAGGIHALARSIGTPRPHAVLAGLVGATSSWLIYWGATAWIPAVVSAAWLSWAAAFLVLSYRSPRFLLLATLAVFLTVASGWPFADAALLAGVGTAILAAWFSGGSRIACTRLAAATTLGILLAAPAWMPLAASFASTQRMAIVFHPHQLQTPPLVLLAVGAPVFPQAWLFVAFQTQVSPPMQYVGWWIPVVLLHTQYSRLRRPAGAAAAILLAVAAVFGLLAAAPAISQLRWPFRFLPYFQIGCAILGAWFLSRPGHAWSPSRTAALVLGTAILAAFQFVNAAYIAFLAAAIILASALLVLRVGGPGSRVGIGVIALSHIVIFCLLTKVFPSNGMLPGWSPALARGEYRISQVALGDASLLLFGSDLFMKADAGSAPASLFVDIPHGNMGLLTGAASIGGYSPIPGTGFAALCMDYIGASCSAAVERWSRIDAMTGASTLDLARVVRVTAETGPQASSFGAAHPDWSMSVGRHGTVFERRRGGPDLPGTISAIPPGLRFGAVQESAAAGRYEVASGEGGRVVWARAWYPGYVAFWNGGRLDVGVVNSILPSVVIPPGPGLLTLRYIPAGLFAGLAVAAAGLLGLVGATWLLSGPRRS
jgi:hypothetical protein